MMMGEMSGTISGNVCPSLFGARVSKSLSVEIYEVCHFAGEARERDRASYLVLFDRVILRFVVQRRCLDFLLC